MPDPGATSGPGESTEEAEVMTDGEEEEDEDEGEKADLRGEEEEVVEEDGRALFMDRSTGSV